MKKKLSTKALIITSVVLFLVFSVSSTLAFIITSTNSIQNIFNPSHVSCAVVENNGTPVESGVVNTGTEKRNVQIKNTGDTDAYIRVAVVVNWSKADGKTVLAQKPVLGTDYTLTLKENSGWTLGSDGYYYYGSSVEPDELTEILIDKVLQKTDSPNGYYLSVEIVASAIQADGIANNAVDAWAKADE